MKLPSAIVLAVLLAFWPRPAASQDAVDVLLSGPPQRQPIETPLLPELAEESSRSAGSDEEPFVAPSWATRVSQDLDSDDAGTDHALAVGPEFSADTAPLPVVDHKNEPSGPINFVPEPSAALLALAALAYFMFFGRRRRVV